MGRKRVSRSRAAKKKNRKARNPQMGRQKVTTRTRRPTTRARKDDTEKKQPLDPATNAAESPLGLSSGSLC